MGVPGFYSWLVRRYPLVLQQVAKGDVAGVDCFYLDMNGIIYKCSKDEGTVFKDLLLQNNLEEIFSLIFNYIDEMVNLIEPKKVLYLFLDGPCPRAKQNQQRTRRFQSAKSWQDLTDSLRNCGFLADGESMKNNSISTGTQFMSDLNSQLHFYICKKFAQDPRWAGLEVFFSGSNVPGEGEHKIIHFMHQYASSPTYDPTTTHCIYGADADLIMLGLSTHIKYVSILREEMKYQPPISRAAKRQNEPPTFQMIYLNMVREYLELEYKMLWKNVKHLQYDIERVIDDFLLICCFIGNDFLPRLYCFNIREGQFEILIQIYKDYLLNGTEYLNNNGYINWVGLEQIIGKISEVEIEFIGDKTSQVISEYKKKIKMQSSGGDEAVEAEERGTEEKKKKKERSHLKNESPSKGEDDSEPSVEENDEDEELEENDDICDDLLETEQDNAKNAETFSQQTFEEKVAEQQKSEVKIMKKEKAFMEQLQSNLEEDNYLGKSFYYLQKLELDFKSIDDLKKLDLLITKYLEGLQFVLLYYYQGCPSWSWYFPFYYSPMTSDIALFLKYKAASLSQSIVFEKSQPYPPMKQLMCIIHPTNASLLPAPFAKLLTDTSSPLRNPVDYFPKEFKIDPYGGVFSHEYIVVLPFMDQSLIDKVYSSVDQEKELTEEERKRNQVGQNIKYKFDPSVPSALVKSTLPSYYPDFSVNVKFEYYEIGSIYSPPRNPTQNEQYSRYPTIHSKEILAYHIERIEKGHQMKLKYKGELQISELMNSQKSKRPNQNITAYAKYPNCEKVRLVGIITAEDLIMFTPNKSQALEMAEYDPDQHTGFYENIKESLFSSLLKQSGLIPETKAPLIAILKKYTEGIRTLSGAIVENEDHFEEYFYPLDLVMKEQRIEKVLQVAKCDKIEEEFPIGCKVVIVEKGPHDGYTGEVLGYKKGSQDLLQIKLLTKPLYMTNDQLNNLSKDDEQFVSLKFLSYKMQVKEDVLLDLLDSFPIQVDPSLASSNKLTKMLDVGIRAIKRNVNEIVPELARINNADESKSGRDRYLQYRDLSVNKSLVKMVVDYYNKFPRIFEAIAKQQKQKKTERSQTVNCNQIFTKIGEDPNIELVKVYIWLMKQKPSQLVSSTIASHVMAQDKVEKIISIYDNYSVKGSAHLSTDASKIVQVDLNNAVAGIFTSKQYIFFNNQPFYHQVGDQAIYIGTYSAKSAPFGWQCTVIGILDNKFEVVFLEPFIGGTSLGGRCLPQRGLIVEFGEIYNLQGWNSFLDQRIKSKQTVKSWNGWVDKFTPQFREPIKSDKDASNAARSSSEVSNLMNEIQSISNAATAIPVQEIGKNGSKITINNNASKQSQPGANIAKPKPAVISKTTQQQTVATYAPKVTIGEGKEVEQKQTEDSTSKQAAVTKDKVSHITDATEHKKTDNAESKQQKQKKVKVPSGAVTYVKKSDLVSKEPSQSEDVQATVIETIQGLAGQVHQEAADDTQQAQPQIMDISEIEKNIEASQQVKQSEASHNPVGQIDNTSENVSEDVKFVDVSEIEKNLANNSEVVPKEIDVAELEKQLLQHAAQDKQTAESSTEPQGIDAAELEKQIEQQQQKQQAETQPVIKKKKQLKTKEDTVFDPNVVVSSTIKQTKEVESKPKKTDKRPKNQQIPLNSQQYRQYQQYLYLYQQQIISQQRQMKQQQDAFTDSLQALVSGATSAGAPINFEALQQAQALSNAGSAGSENVLIQDSSQIEELLAKQSGAQVEQKAQQSIQSGSNVMSSLLDQDELEDFEALEREYLKQIEQNQ